MAGLKDVQKFYNNYHEGQSGRSRTNSSYKKILDLLPNSSKKSKLLDISCGNGQFLQVCVEKGRYSFGVDISLHALKNAAIKAPSSMLCLADAQFLPFKEDSFAQTINIGSLEHLANSRKGLKEQIRVTEQRGDLCLVLPNRNFFIYRLIGKYGTGQIMEKLCSLNEWIAFIEREPIDIVSIRRDRGPDIRTAKSFYSLIGRIFYKLSWRFVPLAYTYQFIFLLRKQAEEKD